MYELVSVLVPFNSMWDRKYVIDIRQYPQEWDYSLKFADSECFHWWMKKNWPEYTDHIIRIEMVPTPNNSSMHGRV